MNTSVNRERCRRQPIEMYKTLPTLIPVPDESPCLPINTDGEEICIYANAHRSAGRGVKRKL